MQYFDDFVSKFGFDDGGHAPSGIEEVRSLYITAINKFAREYNSKWRAIAYNRTGVHNWCLIEFIDATVEVNDYTSWEFLNDEVAGMLAVEGELVDWSSYRIDTEMRSAVDHVGKYDLDVFVTISVDVDWNSYAEIFESESGDE
jgi:hypothetical protein